MTEQQQLVAWRVLAVVALALALATAYIYIKSQRGPSPAGSGWRIAYTVQSDDVFNIVHCGVDGLDCIRLTEGEASELMPVAAPPSDDVSAASRIAFLRLDPQGNQTANAGPGMPGGIYVMETGSGQLTNVSAGLERIVAVRPSWSPDGKQIAFGGVEDLDGDGAYTLDESGVYVSNVETGEMRRVASAALAGWPLSWSPASDLLLATAMEPGDSVPQAFALEISTGITYTHPEIGQITTACWSPEGDRIAAYSREDHQIHVLDSQGDELFAFDAPYGDVLELIWTPWATNDYNEGRLFAVAGSGFELGAGPLYQRSASADSTERWILVAAGQSFTALVSASTDGRYIAFTRFSSEHEGNLFVLERGDAQPRQLTSDPGFEGAATWFGVP